MTKQNERFVIGITGNIGAGKSTVTRALAKAGACVLDKRAAGAGKRSGAGHCRGIRGTNGAFGHFGS